MHEEGKRRVKKKKKGSLSKQLSIVKHNACN